MLTGLKESGKACPSTVIFLYSFSCFSFCCLFVCLFVCLLFQVKCECYWPETIGEEMKLENGFSVLLCESVVFADYTIRSITVTKVIAY